MRSATSGTPNRGTRLLGILSLLVAVLLLPILALWPMDVLLSSAAATRG